MKVDRRIRTMPWPEPWEGENKRQDFHVGVAQAVMGGHRVLVVTVTRNRNHQITPWAAEAVGDDFRLVCCKAKGAEGVAYLTKGGKAVSRKTLDDAICGWKTKAAYCYPEISERDEATLCRWLGITPVRKQDTGYNHGLVMLNDWTADAIKAAKERESREKGDFLDEDVALCPEELPEGLIDYIHRVVFPEDNVLLYKKGNVRGTCWVCGQKVKTTRENKFTQLARSRCPNCGRMVRCYLETGESFAVDNVEPVATIQLGTDGATLFIRQWRLLRPQEPETLWERTEECLKEVARYAVRGRYAAKWQREAKEAYYMRSWRYDIGHWERMRNVTEVYDGSYYFFVPPNWREILAPTSLRYMDMAEYDRIDRGDVRTDKNMIRFCMDWTRYPAVELLWKAGYRRLVNERVNGWTTKENRNAIRWSGRSLGEAFKFPLRLLKCQEPGKWDNPKVAKVAKLWEIVATGDMREADLRLVAECRVGVEYIRDALPYATARQVVKYVNRQYDLEEERRDREKRENKERGEYHYREPLQTGVTFRDYLRDCGKLGLDLRDRQVLFPPDLEAAHQRTISAVKYEADKVKEKAYQATVKRLGRLSWEKGGLLIRPAATVRELIEEGAALHHCVGGYADRVANGTTAIFLIRRAAEPDKPYYTLELQGKRVIQCRTDHNRSYERDKSVLAFVEEWLERIVNRKKKQKKEANVA